MGVARLARPDGHLTYRSSQGDRITSNARRTRINAKSPAPTGSCCGNGKRGIRDLFVGNARKVMVWLSSPGTLTEKVRSTGVAAFQLALPVCA
ncbi:MAG: hypothetical protein R2825_27960 [Saprospiraceae bacterium]